MGVKGKTICKIAIRNLRTPLFILTPDFSLLSPQRLLAAIPHP